MVVLLVVCVFLIIFFPDLFWIVLLALIGGSVAIGLRIQRNREQQAPIVKQAEKGSERDDQEPAHTHHEPKFEKQDSDYVHTPSVRSTNPTAQNAYIYNLDYIKSCQSFFIALDIETTGLSPANDRIVELSAIRYENCIPCESFSTLINPQRHIPSSASSVNHITDEDVKNAPLEKDAIDSFCSFIGKDALQGDIVLVAHNALFDIKFLLYALSRSGIEAQLSFEDTLHLSRGLGLGLSNYKLQTIAEHYGIIQENAHRAADDARTCGEIFIRLLQAKLDEHTAKFSYLSSEEMELCVWLKNCFVEAELNTQLLTFYNKSYLQVKCYGEVARFKTNAKKPYALISRSADIPSGVETVEPSKAEAEKYLRVYFTSPKDLEPLKPYYISEYKKVLANAEEYISDSTDRMKFVARQIDRDICI